MLHVGIQLDPPYLLASLIEKGRKGISVLSLQSSLSSHPDDVKRLYMKDFKGKIHTALSASELLLRPFEIEIADSRYLEEAIAFQAEATSHLPAGEFLTIPWVKRESKSKEKKKIDTLLLTVPRQTLCAHLETCKKLCFEPDSVSLVSSALCHFLQWRAPSLKDAFLVHLGSNEWTCIWMQGGVLKKSHCIAGGTEALLLALWEDRKRIHLQKEIGGVAKQIDLLQFKPHLNIHLAETLHALRQELSKVIFSFHRNAGEKPLFFTGRVDAFAHFTEFLTHPLQSAIVQENSNFLTPDTQKFAISLGIALEQTSSTPLQFLNGEFFPRKNWRRLGVSALTLLGTSLVLSAAVLGLAWKGFEQRKNHMISSLEHSLAKWEPHLASEHTEELLAHWIEAVETHNKEYPYILQAPRASELLSWLSTYPLFQNVALRDIRYQLVQFPHIGALQEAYLTQVEVEFQVEETTHARRIHEALLKGEGLVDASKEIKWEALHDSYRAIFFLKNRGPHVP